MGVALRSRPWYSRDVARLCSVCQHPQRSDIDRALTNPNSPLIRVSEAFGINRDTLRRHRDKCIARAVSNTLAKQELAVSGSLLSDVARMRDKVATIIDNSPTEATEVRSNRDFNASMRSYLSTVEHVARLSGHPAYQTSHQQVSIDARGGKFLLMPYSGEPVRELGPAPDPIESSD